MPDKFHVSFSTINKSQNGVAQSSVREHKYVFPVKFRNVISLCFVSDDYKMKYGTASGMLGIQALVY